MLYSHNNEYPAPLPERIRLSSGLTRTDSSTFTAEEIADAGYVSVEDPPSFEEKTEKLTWNGSAWEVIALTDEELAVKNVEEWAEIRGVRDNKIKEVEWRVFRYQSEERAGITTHTDNISDLDDYIKKLRDIPQTYSSVGDIVWPDTPWESEEVDSTDNS
tara:strand:+ start:714 stop:1193 length:480 start_codon:yes stop_codon:yes gene_type:complete